MPKFICPYVADGVRYKAMIDAPNRATAAAKMEALPWEPGSGPCGPPSRLGPSPERTAMVASIGIALACLYVGASAAHLRHEEHKFQTFASQLVKHHSQKVG